MRSRALELPDLMWELKNDKQSVISYQKYLILHKFLYFLTLVSKILLTKQKAKKILFEVEKIKGSCFFCFI